MTPATGCARLSCPLPIEREGGIHQPEHELPPYSRTARFAGEVPAGTVYGAVQALLYRSELATDLSCYRFQLNQVSSWGSRRRAPWIGNWRGASPRV